MSSAERWIEVVAFALWIFAMGTAFVYVWMV